MSEQTAGCGCYGCKILVPKLWAEVDRVREQAAAEVRASEQIAVSESDARLKLTQRAEQAEAEAARLREALEDLLVHIPNGTAVDPYKKRAHEALAHPQGAGGGK